MVNMRLLGIVTCCLTLHLPHVSASNELVLVSPTSVVIKPCQPVYIVLEGPAQIDDEENAFQAVSEITVNQRTYRMRTPGVNGAALVFANEFKSDESPDSPPAVRLTVVVYWDAEDTDFVFREPGSYVVGIGESTSVTVKVEQPTLSELHVIDKMRALGAPFALYCMQLAGRGEHGVADALESLAPLSKGTAYESLIGVALGISKLYNFKLVGDPDPADFLAQRTSVAKEYLERFCQSDPTSPVSCAAAYNVSTAMSQQAQFLRSRDPQVAEQLIVDSRALLLGISESKYAAQFGPLAMKALQTHGQ